VLLALLVPSVDLLSILVVHALNLLKLSVAQLEPCDEGREKAKNVENSAGDPTPHLTGLLCVFVATRN
jgi:hypothetical protein